MNMDQVHYFLHVTKSKSINKTASHFMVPHQSVSISLRNLEDELGYLLLNRSPKGVTLTKEGETAVVFFNEMLTSYQKLILLKSDTSSALTGTLSVMTAPFFSLITSNDFPMYFLKMHPNINLNLKTQENFDIIQHLNENSADLFIIVSDPHTSTLDENIDRSEWHVEKTLEDKLLAIVSHEHPLKDLKSISLNTLCNYPYSLFQASNNSENLTFKFFPENKQPIIKYRTDNLDSLIDVIINTHSFALIPQLANIKKEFISKREKICLIPVTDTPPIFMSAIYRTNLSKNKIQLIQTFLDYFVRFIGLKRDHAFEIGDSVQ